MLKKVLLLGATGKTGRVIIDRLKDDSEIELTAFARSPEKLSGIDSITVAKGDTTDEQTLAEAMTGKDIVVAALSGDTILQQAEAVVSAMKQSGVNRIIWMTGMGIHHEVPGLTGKMLDMLVRSQPEYVRAADMVMKSGLQFTLLRGAHLTDGRNRNYQIQHEGKRIFVDRLWARGLTKEKAQIDEWRKDISPSKDLRKWYGHDPEKFEEFRKRYRAEPDANPAADEFAHSLDGTVTLLFGAKDAKHSNAAVLKEWIEGKKRINP